VTGGNLVCAASAGDRREGAVAPFACAFLDVAVMGQGRTQMRQVKGHVEARRERAGDLGVGISLRAAQAMMDVRRRHTDLEASTQQCKRGSAGERDQRVGAGHEQRLVSDRLPNGVEESTDRALHGTQDFDMVPAATQMRCVRIVPVVAFLILAGRDSALLAEEELPIPTPAGVNPEIVRALAEVRRKYGPDAVVMEGVLLSHAIQKGAVLETAVTVGDLEEREARKYLLFTVDTGIVYNDRELTPEARLGRTWTRIVERSLRTFRSLSVPADGLRLTLSYSHKSYVDEPDLRSHLRDGHGEPESAVIYLTTNDVGDLIAAKIDGQQLADRAVVLLNGTPVRVRVEPPETPVSEAPQP